MTYEIYRYIFIGGAIAAGVFLITTVILLFALHIPHVIGDLSGANARKAIQNIRLQNEQTGVKVYKSSAVNQERGQLTDKISQSGRLMTRGNTSGFGMRTEKISTQLLSQQAAETTLLGHTEMLGGNETTVLDAGMPGANETTVLDAGMLGGNETTVLDAGMSGGNETTVLDAGMLRTNEAAASGVGAVFVIEQEITFIHTEEMVTA